MLKSLGFEAGLEDFESCGFDLDILRDWYAMIRSLQPQNSAHLQLMDWVGMLFHDDDSSLLQQYITFSPTTEGCAAAASSVPRASATLLVSALPPAPPLSAPV